MQPPKPLGLVHNTTAQIKTIVDVLTFLIVDVFHLFFPLEIFHAKKKTYSFINPSMRFNDCDVNHLTK
jgi:uncharacterized protein (DUF486 family)